MGKWLCKGDTVVVVSGNYKGKIAQVVARRGRKAIVEGVNMRKKTVRKTEEQPEGGFISIEGTIDVSNLALCDGQGKKRKLRVRHQDGGKELVYDQEGQEHVHRVVKQKR